MDDWSGRELANMSSQKKLISLVLWVGFVSQLFCRRRIDVTRYESLLSDSTPSRIQGRLIAI